MALRPDAYSFDFNPADAIIDRACTNELGVRGHTVLRHYECSSRNRDRYMCYQRQQ